MRGRMFNSYAYGGYLLWRLAPQIKVFIDGRGLDPQVFSDWEKITAASMVPVDGRAEYEVLLDTYAIDYVIQPIYQGDGSIQPLMKKLLNKPDWIPIYVDTYVYILAKYTPDNAADINKYVIGKSEFKTRLLMIYNYIGSSYPRQIGYKVAKAGMLIYMEMYEEARRQIYEIEAIDKNDRSLPKLRRDLEILAAKKM